MPTRISDFLNTTFSTLSLNDAVNNGISYPASVVHTTTGTPGVGIGAGIQFQVETSDNNTELGMTIETVTTDVTAPSEDFDLIVKLMQNGNPAAERLRLNSSGVLSAGSFATTSSVAPANGMFLPAANTLGFSTTNVERIRIDSAGRIGVGTTTILNNVEIGINQNAPTVFRVINQNSGGSAAAVLQLAVGSTPGGVNWTCLPTFNQLVGAGGVNSNFFDFDTQIWRTNLGTERMRINSDGNVAIGTTVSTQARLNIQGITGANTIGELYMTDGTQWTRMATNLAAGAYNGIVGANDHAIIYSNGTQLTGGLAITPWTSAAVPTSGMRLDNNGNVSIGQASVTAGYELDVGGSVRVVGGIVATGEITAFFSDTRLKANITAITNAVDKVMSINGVYYNANDLAVKIAGEDKTIQRVGLLAQEVEAVLPHVVKAAPFDIGDNGISKTGEHYKTLQYDRIVPLLVEAIKEQQVQISQLTDRVTTLEGKLNGK